MFKSYYIFFVLFIPLLVNAQQISGMVIDETNTPLIGATLQIANSSVGVISDINGAFQLAAKPGDLILVSFVGYKADTIEIKSMDPIQIAMQPAEGELEAVVIKSETTFIDNLEPITNEIILESELLKAACCNLSESFETNASVDVSFTDAVSGARTIKMLGLDGRYVQIIRENIPHVRGLNSRYGISFVPGTWMQSIDVGKGAGSVVNGFESMVGQINLEFKKPEISERLYLNAYVNSFGRSELNVNVAAQLNDRWSTAMLTHANYLPTSIDRNSDGFLDLPQSRQINLLNRYKYQGDRINSQIGINFMLDEKAGGQAGFGFGDDFRSSPLYGFVNNTMRAELFGKLGILYPKKPYQGWGFIYSISMIQMDGGFGRNPYKAEEKSVYLNAIHQNIIGSSFHQYKTGGNLQVNLFDEQYQTFNTDRNEVVPGGFFEYSYLPSDQLSLVIGNRIDIHNLYGLYWVPRIHLRYELLTGTTLRYSIGKGYRTPYALMDNLQILNSARQISFTEELLPEISWNTGVSLNSNMNLGGLPTNLAVDYFYTGFTNQLVADMDSDHNQVVFSNLNGDSYSHSFQTQLSASPFAGIDFKTAYKYYDVRQTIGGELRHLPFLAQHRFFANAAYATKYEKWKADITWQWRGKSRLPNMLDYDGPAREFQNQSPAYSLINMQISRGFRKGSVYLGAENLLDFRQQDPIVDVDNPFGEYFDASMVWGPVAGRVIYAGFRYKIKKR
ncbi:MAG: carboxypeptidase-like regulatory domain-containing protein [Cyclobacteriaceae bacterium]